MAKSSRVQRRRSTRSTRGSQAARPARETRVLSPAEHVAFAFGPHRPRIHPGAFLTYGTYVVGEVTIGRGVSVWFGAVLRGDAGRITVGEGSLIEDNVVIHGRVRIGTRCVIGHGAIIHGCTIGDRAIIGSNAVVFDGAIVGKGALVTAGSVVHPGTRVPAGKLFRNSAGVNRPSIEPIGDRVRRWKAENYNKLMAVYQGRRA